MSPWQHIKLTAWLAGIFFGIFLLHPQMGSATICSQVGSDNFTRANGGLGSNWSDNAGTWAISSDTAVQTAAVLGAAYWSANTFSSTQCGGVTVAAWDTTSNNLVGVAIYVQTGAVSFYDLWCQTVTSSNCTKLAVWKLSAGSGTPLATWCSSGCTHTVTLNITPGTEIALVGNGSGTLSVYLKCPRLLYQSVVGYFETERRSSGARPTATTGVITRPLRWLVQLPSKSTMDRAEPVRCGITLAR